MEPEDGGQHQNMNLNFEDYHHSCSSSATESDSRRRRTNPEMNFATVQMTFRRRRRGGGVEESPHHNHSFHPEQSMSRTRHSSKHAISSSYSPSFSPLVLLTTSLLLFLCLAPLSLVHSLPFDSRSSASLGGYGGGSHRSQMDLLIDPIHQAEYGDDEPLESKRVVAKSVFDMVLRTPPPPTSSSNRCPPGTQSPFEGGPCIKKSTDPVALVDQSFLLDTLRGLAKDGVLLSTGPTKTRKRRPGKPGGGSRTTPSPTTPQPTPTMTMTTTMESTPPTSGDVLISNVVVEESLSPSNSEVQPVFEEETTKLLMDTVVPSTLPTTLTPTAEESTTTTAGIISDIRRVPSPSSSSTAAASQTDDEEQNIVRITTSPLELATSLPETTLSTPSLSSAEANEQEKSGQDHQQQKNEAAQESLIMMTTQPAPQSSDGEMMISADVGDDAGSQISPETTGMTVQDEPKIDSQDGMLSTEDDPSASPTPETFSQKEIALTTSKLMKSDELIAMTDKDKDSSTIPSITSSLSSAASFEDNVGSDIGPSGAGGEEMTGVPTSSASLELLLADEGEKQLGIDFIEPADKHPDKLISTRMIVDLGKEKNVLILDRDNAMMEEKEQETGTTLPKTMSPSSSLSTGAEEEEEGRAVTPVTLNDPEDSKAAEQSPQEPIIRIKSKQSITEGGEVESKRNDGDDDDAGQRVQQEGPLQQVEPSRQGTDEEGNLIKQKEQVEEGLTQEGILSMMMMKGEDPDDMMSMTGSTTENQRMKGVVIGEEQSEPERGDRQPSSTSPVVNHWTEEPSEQVIGGASGDGEGKEKEVVETVMPMMTTSTLPEMEIGDGVDGDADDDLRIINNLQISSSPSRIQFEMNKDGGGEIGGTDPAASSSEKDGNRNGMDDDNAGSSREDFTIVARDEIPATSSSSPEVVFPSTTLSSILPSPPFKDRDSTLLQFQLPIVTTGPNHVESSREEKDDNVGGGVGGFQKFPEFPVPTGRIRFPSLSSDNIEVPVEGGSAIPSRDRGTTRPIFVQDFQLDYPPLKSQEPQQQYQQQQWQSPKPFLIPPQTASTPLPSRTAGRPDQTAHTAQPDYYESGSTEYLESELDRRHQKTRSRNRIRTQDQHQHLLPSSSPSTNQPLPAELSFFPRNSQQPYHHHQNTNHNHHQIPSSSSPPSLRQPQPPPPSRSPHPSSPQHQHHQQPFFFARRNPSSSEFGPFGYLNYRPAGHDRFHNNNRRLIW